MIGEDEKQDRRILHEPSVVNYAKQSNRCRHHDVVAIPTSDEFLTPRDDNVVAVLRLTGTRFNHAHENRRKAPKRRHQCLRRPGNRQLSPLHSLRNRQVLRRFMTAFTPKL